MLPKAVAPFGVLKPPSRCCSARRFSACDPGSRRPKYVEEAVLFGYLYVGESVSDDGPIRLGRTLPVDQHYDAGQAAILDAIVTLRADTAVVAETLRMVAPGIYANRGVVIRARTTYHLQALFDGKTVTGTTTTPRAFETPHEPRVASEGAMPQSAIADSFPIVAACPDPEQIFLLYVYCLENWQNLYRDHPERNSGVNGGIGAFGSACRRRYDVMVVE